MTGAEQIKLSSTPIRSANNAEGSSYSPLSVFMKKLLLENQEGACTTILVVEDNPACICGRTCSSLAKEDSPLAYRWKNGALKDSIRPKRRLPSMDDAILSIAAAEIVGAAADILASRSPRKVSLGENYIFSTPESYSNETERKTTLLCTK
jgi:hypothetical protein